MYSQMHQPDVLLLVKESLSVSRESLFISIPIFFLQNVYKNICAVLSSLRRSGSRFSRQGACGHLHREEEVCIQW